VTATTFRVGGAMMKDAIRTIGPQFSTRRMVKEYTENY
jgi:hypothetical protein